MSRYSVFIDGGYFKKVLQEFGRPNISYLKFSNEVADGEDRLRTYYYDCPPFLSDPPTPDEKDRQANFDRFLLALVKEPRFQVRLGRLAKYETSAGIKFQQKKVDVLLTCDLLRLSLEKQISRAVIVAGDSDFVPAIEIARDAGTLVQLFFSKTRTPHQELLAACDERICIDQDLIDRIRT